MSTLAELQAATQATITQAPLVVDLTKPIQFVGRRDDAGVLHLTFTATLTNGQLITVPEFPMPAVPAAYGGQAALDFAAASNIVFPMIRGYALSLVGATAGAPP